MKDRYGTPLELGDWVVWSGQSDRLWAIVDEDPEEGTIGVVSGPEHATFRLGDCVRAAQQPGDDAR